MRILCIGDVVGSVGCTFLRNKLPVIKKLKGIPCKNKGTSCPDQLARALEKIKEKEAI